MDPSTEKWKVFHWQELRWQEKWRHNKTSPPLENRFFPPILTMTMASTHWLLRRLQLKNDEENERQVSHTYSMTGEPPIKRLAVIRAQQLGRMRRMEQEQTSSADSDPGQGSFTKLFYLSVKCWYKRWQMEQNQLSSDLLQFISITEK